MKFSKLKPRELRFLILVGVSLFLFLNYMLVWPQWERVQSQKIKIAQLKSDVQIQNEALRLAPDWKKELAKFSKEREGSSPDVVSQEAWMKHFESIAKKSNVELPQRRASKGESHSSANLIRVECSLQGSLEAVVKFLYALQKDAAHPQVESCQLSPIKAGDEKLRGNLAVIVMLKPVNH